MLKQLIKPIYHLSHDLLFQTRQLNPLFKQKHGGYPILQGHISDEHLADPALEELLANGLREIGVRVAPYKIDVEGYYQYLERAQYPATYYGGGLDPQQNFTEKTLEHYVSLDFLNLQSDSVFVDVAACTSPFFQIIRRLCGTQKTYNQDLIFEPGLHGDRIGGYGHELHLPDNSVDGVTLHCSLEHFEDDTDTKFFQELERVLKPGGRAIILPFYLAHEYTIHVDPAYNLLKNHRPSIDPKARLRYCNWYQFFSRHYDPQALQERILSQAPSLKLTVHQVQNFREVDADSYLRLIGVFEKQA